MKPTYADYCHPKTWLHQGRWMDEADPQQDAISETGRYNQQASIAAVSLILGAEERRRGVRRHGD